MTVNRAGAEPYCSQHHQPKSDCEVWDRHTHSLRFREDMWADAERAAASEKSDVTTFITEMTEAGLGYVRCHRCSLAAGPVPAEFGDLTGKPLRQWVAEAVRQVVKQHPNHEPVTIGAASGSAPAPVAAKDVIFREPQPAQ